MNRLNPKATWYFFFMFMPVNLIFAIMVSPWLYMLFSSSDQATGNIATFLLIVLILALCAGVFSWFWARLSYANYKYELKDEGVTIERGVIWKKYATIPYDRIQNVDILRGLIARILGLSDLQIQTAGGVASGSYGAYSEGRLPGLSPDVANQLRDEVLKVSKQSRRSSQGL